MHYLPYYSSPIITSYLIYLFITNEGKHHSVIKILNKQINNITFLWQLILLYSMKLIWNCTSNVWCCNKFCKIHVINKTKQKKNENENRKIIFCRFKSINCSTGLVKNKLCNLKGFRQRSTAPIETKFKVQLMRLCLLNNLEKGRCSAQTRA